MPTRLADGLGLEVSYASSLAIRPIPARVHGPDYWFPRVAPHARLRQTNCE